MNYKLCVNFNIFNSDLNNEEVKWNYCVVLKVRVLDIVRYFVICDFYLIIVFVFYRFFMNIDENGMVEGFEKYKK